MLTKWADIGRLLAKKKKRRIDSCHKKYVIIRNERSWKVDQFAKEKSNNLIIHVYIHVYIQFYVKSSIVFRFLGKDVLKVESKPAKT